MALNKEQEKAVKYIENWWRCNQMYLVMDAKAGVGKTFTINYVLDKLDSCTPLLLCPTNEALSQLKDKIDNPEKYTFRTVHSALGITPTTDTKELEFSHIKIPSLWDNYNLAIVDEASMIDDFLLDLLRSTKIKIIWVGHSSQLPPVDVNRKLTDSCVSPVFSQGWETITLTQPMRHVGDLWEFNIEVEKLIESQETLPPSKYDVKKKELDNYINSEEGKQDFLSGETKIAAWSNNGVNKLNHKVRKAIHGKQAEKSKYLKGDKIVLTKPYTMVEVDKYNDADLKRLAKKNDDLETLYSNTKATVIEASFVKVKLNQTLDFWCHKIIVETEEETCTIYEIASKGILEKVMDYYEKVAWSMKTPKATANAYKQRHFILSCFAEVQHYFAATSHRLQGTSIPNIIVMYGDIMKNMNKIERAKCLYVACSRSMNSLKIFRGAY